MQVVEAGFLDDEHAGQPADPVHTRDALRVWDVVYGFGPAEAEVRLEAWCATGGAR